MKAIFGEVVTALVTPFDEQLNVDFKSLEKLVNHLVESGTDTVLIGGTTGESPNLSSEELVRIVDFVRNQVPDYIKIMIGAGSNSTDHTVELVKNAEKMGADFILTVAPYYNKPSQAGLFEHFCKIADSTTLPICLYNIPGRTGVNIEPDTIANLAKSKSNIVAVKQSNDNLDLISQMKILCPDDFAIYCGDDNLTLPMVSMGCAGVVSVASHIIGNDIKSMIKNIQSGNLAAARQIHLDNFHIFKQIFMAPNPVPIKQVLAKMGIIEHYVRLPLVALDGAQKKELFDIINTDKLFIKR